MNPWKFGQEEDVSSDDAVVLDHLSLSSIAHNLHYKYEKAPLTWPEANEYAGRLLDMIGYKHPDQMTVNAALQAWQTMYPQDSQLEAPKAPIAVATTPTESWGSGTVGKLTWTGPQETGDPGTSAESYLPGEYGEEEDPINNTPTASSIMAAQHTGQIPGDENLMGDLQIHGKNPNSGVNASYLGAVGERPVYVKPQGNYHDDDLACERAAFAIAHHMGVPVPHTVVRNCDFGPAQVQQSVGGYTMTDELGNPFGFDALIRQYPKDARQIALFDNVIGNVDRHLGNVVKGDDGKIYPIDHGGAFGAEYEPEFLASRFANKPLTPYEQQALKKAGTLDLTEMGIDPQAHQEVQDRINTMLRNGKFLAGPGNPYASRV